MTQYLNIIIDNSDLLLFKNNTSTKNNNELHINTYINIMFNDCP